ncbi:MAG: ABC transporter permease [Bacteroidota bacterium]
MIQHILKLIWNKRKKNSLLFLEIFLAFAVLFFVFSLVVEQLRKFVTPLGFKTTDSWMAYMEFDEEMDSLALIEMKTLLERELLDKPEIESVSYMGQITPFSGSNWSFNNDSNGFELSSNMLFTDHNYLEAAELELVEGRWFEEGDLNAKYKPAVFSRQLVEGTFGTKPVLDSVYNLSGGEYKIIGVVGNYKYLGEFEDEKNMSFFYLPKHAGNLNNLLIKVQEGTSPEFEAEVNETIALITKRNDFTIQHLEDARQRLSNQVWVPMAALLSICGFLIINVALGLFGVLWYTISKRKAEIGLRRTLGATQGKITFQFIGEVFLVTLIAVLSATFFAIQVPLMNVVEMDDINFYMGIILSSVIIFSVVLICSFYPSKQASGIHPAIALHEE